MPNCQMLLHFFYRNVKVTSVSSWLCLQLQDKMTFYLFIYFCGEDKHMCKEKAEI